MAEVETELFFYTQAGRVAEEKVETLA